MGKEAPLERSGRRNKAVWTIVRTLKERKWPQDQGKERGRGVGSEKRKVGSEVEVLGQERLRVNHETEGGSTGGRQLAKDLAIEPLNIRNIV